MSLILLLSLIVACGVMMLVERAGVRTTLQLSFKGDVKRETAFLAQWGQSVATPLVWFALGEEKLSVRLPAAKARGLAGEVRLAFNPTTASIFSKESEQRL